MHSIDNGRVRGLFRFSPLLPRPPLPESLGDVTRLAAPPKRAAMRVVAAVAAKARGGSRDFRGVFGGMTGVALQSLVRASQRKLGFLVMVKAPKCEAVGVVAARAIGAQPALVALVLVTGFARPRRILVGPRPMTFLAGDCCMQPNQRELGQVMIKSDLRAPAGFSVAGLAFRPELALMRIVFLVT